MEDPAVQAAPENALPLQVLTEDAKLHVCNLVAQGMPLKEAQAKAFAGLKPQPQKSASQKADELL